MAVKEFWKSVHICQSYDKKSSVLFFETQCSTKRVPAVRLSVTTRYRFKSRRDTGLFTVWYTRVSNFIRANFVPLGEEIPLERGHQRGYPLRHRYFTTIASSSKRTQTCLLHIITSTADELSGGTNIDDLERPWTPKVRLFSNFLRSQAAIHVEWTASKSLEVDQDNLQMKFSTLSLDFNGPSFNHLGSRSPSYGGIKFRYLLQNARFCYCRRDLK